MNLPIASSVTGFVSQASLPAVQSARGPTAPAAGFGGAAVESLSASEQASDRDARERYEGPASRAEGAADERSSDAPAETQDGVWSELRVRSDEPPSLLDMQG